MTTPQEREQEIREREQKATPGPWNIMSFGMLNNIIAPFAQPGVITIVVRLDDGQPALRDCDGRFISAARTDVPFLLSRIQQLEQALEAAKAATVRPNGTVDHINAFGPDCYFGYTGRPGKPEPCTCWISEHDAAIDTALSTMPAGEVE